MYSLIRPLLFAAEPELAHEWAMKGLSYCPSWLFRTPKPRPTTVMNLAFKHPVGLAAGFDKNGAYLDILDKLGFSFVELGTVTPKAQPGNPKPRLFRIPEKGALINRLGFNNDGVDALVANVRRSSFKGLIGINIGKNKDTSLDKAAEDYLYCLRQAFSCADYITVNISSPNTPNLRDLQQEDYFRQLLDSLREEQLLLSDAHKRYVPLLVKLSPDESDASLKRMAAVARDEGVDGLVMTNTTLKRDTVEGLKYADETGGLSGRPLYLRATHCLRVVKEVVGDELAIISVGGIDSPERAKERMIAGASLLQVYTGLIYKGPGLVSQLVDGILNT